MTDCARQPVADTDAVMDCPRCGAVDGMCHTHDLTNGLDRKAGEVWTCAECGAECIDEW